jgi:hypothetical protein
VADFLASAGRSARNDPQLCGENAVKSTFPAAVERNPANVPALTIIGKDDDPRPIGQKRSSESCGGWQ